MINGLPERLRDMREKLNYSQREVAKRLDVSPSLISGYETGERTPSVEILLQISYLYKCSVDYLLGKSRDGQMLTVPIEGMTPNQIQILTDLVNEFQLQNKNREMAG